MKRADIKPGVVYAYESGKYDAVRPVLVVDAAYWERRQKPQFSRDHDTTGWKCYRTHESQARKIGTGEDERVWKPEDRFSGGDHMPIHGLAAIDMAGAQRRKRSEEATNLEIQDEIAGVLTEFARSKGVPALRKMFADLPYNTSSLPSPKGARAHLVNPSWIKGEWAEVVGDRLEEEARRRDVSALARAESEARVAAATKRVESLRALGLPGEIADPAEATGYRYQAGWAEWKPPVYRGNTGAVKLTMSQVDALLSLIPEDAKWTPGDVEPDGWTLRKPEYDEESDGDDDD